MCCLLLCALMVGLLPFSTLITREFPKNGPGTLVCYREMTRKAQGYYQPVFIFWGAARRDRGFVNARSKIYNHSPRGIVPMPRFKRQPAALVLLVVLLLSICFARTSSSF